MAGNSNTNASRQPALAGVQVQTSLYGLAVPLVWGRVRLGGNLLWYGDFKATAVADPSQSGGKGGGGGNGGTTHWEYSAAVMMGLCAGPINDVVSAWKGKARVGGAGTPSRTRTLKTTVHVPPTGGLVTTVPQAADFTRNVAVRSLANNIPGGDWRDGNAVLAQGGVLLEGIGYTRSGATYTFPNDWANTDLEIEYQILENIATQSALGPLGMNLATGALGQAVWPHLTSDHSAQAIGYSGLAYVYSLSYKLNDSAQVENHNFEISTPSEFSSSIPDADMSRVVAEFLTDGLRGCMWPADRLDSMAAYSSYCVSHGLFMSPELTEQTAAAETLHDWLTLTNSNAVWSGLKLRIVPLGDEAKTANGATYTPVTTPVYDLAPGDFVHDAGSPRIKVQPRPNEDAFNVIRVEYRHRDNDYTVEIAEARDLAHIEQYGERVKDVISAHAAKTPEVATFIAQMELQRQMGIWNDYTFTVGWMKGRLEPLDLLTLTEPGLYMDRVPVRITRITEDGEDAFVVDAEDAPIGMASAPLYGAQGGSGYRTDYNAAPGDVDAPVIFELPAQLATETGLQLAVAVRGSGANWGGCQVWASLDGTNYQRLGVVYGGARYGTLSAAVGASAYVQGLGAAQLLSGSSADAAALRTLCYVGGTTPEYLAYETATLTGAGAYTLGGLVRGAYSTPSSTHATGEPFVRVDESIVKSEPLELARIGSTVHFKFTSFNVFGGAEQSLADVADYTYVISGVFAGERRSYRIVARGINDTYPTAPGIYNASTGSFINTAYGGYLLVKINKVTREVDESLKYDVATEGQSIDAGGDGTTPFSGRSGYTLMTQINAATSDHWLVIATWGDPKPHRFDYGLDAAMYSIGASRAVFGNEAVFKAGGAYILIGEKNLNEGNGREAYSGATDNATTAWCDVLIWFAGGAVQTSGSTYTPSAPTVTISATAPLNPRVKDIWKDSASGNKEYEWSGSAWVAVQVGTDAMAQNVATDVVKELVASDVYNTTLTGAIDDRVLGVVGYLNNNTTAVEVEITISSQRMFEVGSGFSGTAQAYPVIYIDVNGALVGPVGMAAFEAPTLSAGQIHAWTESRAWQVALDPGQYIQARSIMRIVPAGGSGGSVTLTTSNFCHRLTIIKR